MPPASEPAAPGGDAPALLPPLDGLAPPVRVRVLGLAAAALGGLPEADVPPPLRRVRTFTAAKRARLGAAALAAALEDDRVFRAAVVAGVRAGPPPAEGSDAPVAAAAAAWLLRDASAPDLLRRATAHLEQAQGLAADRAGDVEVGRLRRALAELQERSAAAAVEHTEVVDQLRAQVAEARRRARPVEQAARLAEAAAHERVAQAERAAAQARDAAAAAARERDRLRSRVADLDAALSAARRLERGERAVDDARLRVLLDTLLSAGQGLRRALALGVADAEHPGDAVVAALGVPAPAVTSTVTETHVLDVLLALPSVHVVVDGYNVTKTGYGEISLEAQRSRLLAGLAALVARTGAEITVVFDGAGRPALSTPGRDPRGVRVAWSPPGVTADDVVLRFVDAEPAGRPVLVVSSDGEVVTGARRRGARPVASAALLARLNRA